MKPRLKNECFCAACNIIREEVFAALAQDTLPAYVVHEYHENPAYIGSVVDDGSHRTIWTIAGDYTGFLKIAVVEEG